MAARGRRYGVATHDPPTCSARNIESRIDEDCRRGPAEDDEHGSTGQSRVISRAICERSNRHPAGHVPLPEVSYNWFTNLGGCDTYDLFLSRAKGAEHVDHEGCFIVLSETVKHANSHPLIVYNCYSVSCSSVWYTEFPDTTAVSLYDMLYNPPTLPVSGVISVPNMLNLPPYPPAVSYACMYEVVHSG